MKTIVFTLACFVTSVSHAAQVLEIYSTAQSSPPSIIEVNDGSGWRTVTVANFFGVVYWTNSFTVESDTVYVRLNADSQKISKFDGWTQADHVWRLVLQDGKAREWVNNAAVVSSYGGLRDWVPLSSVFPLPSEPSWDGSLWTLVAYIADDFNSVLYAVFLGSSVLILSVGTLYAMLTWLKRSAVTQAHETDGYSMHDKGVK